MLLEEIVYSSLLEHPVMEQTREEQNEYQLTPLMRLLSAYLMRLVYTYMVFFWYNIFYATGK